MASSRSQALPRIRDGFIVTGGQQVRNPLNVMPIRHFSIPRCRWRFPGMTAAPFFHPNQRRFPLGIKVKLPRLKGLDLLHGDSGTLEIGFHRRAILSGLRPAEPEPIALAYDILVHRGRTLRRQQKMKATLATHRRYVLKYG